MLVPKNKPSVWALVIANLIPLAGVLFWGWRVLDIMLLYWTESGVIGFYNLFKIIRVGKWLSVFLVPFFILHFGIFMFAHLAFILIFFGKGQFISHDFPLNQVLDTFINLSPAVITLFVSHGVSFFVNYLGKREYRHPIMAGFQMFAPYKRVVLMHITLIVGGMISMITGTPPLALALLVVLKIIIDLFAHMREHGYNQSHERYQKV